MAARKDARVSGGIMGYLDACWGVSDAQWLGISEEASYPRADFWTIAQVVPGELRRKGDELARRWVDGEPPVTALECWFRRIVFRLGRRDMAPVEPWVILYAMAHAYGGWGAPSPVEYAQQVKMPIDSDTFQRAVSTARDEMDDECDDVGRYEAA